MACSWNSGTPTGLAEDILQLVRIVWRPGPGIGHRGQLPLRRFRYGWTMFALDRPRPDDGHLDDQVVELRCGFRRGSIDICARLSTWNTPTESAARCASRRPALSPHLSWGISCGESVITVAILPGARSMRSKLLRRPVSMPSARISTFRMPSASMSSLSHSMKVRSLHGAVFENRHQAHRGESRVMHETADMLAERWRGKPVISTPATTNEHLTSGSGSCRIEACVSGS